MEPRHSRLAFAPVAPRSGRTRQPGGRRTQVHVHRAIRGGRLPSSSIAAILRRMLRDGRIHGDVHVIIADDRRMRLLNRRFRGRNRPTDVLAFPFAVPASAITGGALLGEIYCSYDHAGRWQQEHGGTMAAELVRLAVHGCLHLLGYDHHTTADRKRMTAAEDKYLTLGLIGVRAGKIAHDG